MALGNDLKYSRAQVRGFLLDGVGRLKKRQNVLKEWAQAWNLFKNVWKMSDDFQDRPILKKGSSWEEKYPIPVKYRGKVW